LTTTEMEEKEKRLKALEELSRLDEKLDLGWPESREIEGLKLVCTSPACPEQYDVFDSQGVQIGYLRLRHGRFRADYPDCGGDTVYVSNTKGDGAFEESERLPELTNAVRKLKERQAKDACTGPATD